MYVAICVGLVLSVLFSLGASYIASRIVEDAKKFDELRKQKDAELQEVFDEEERSNNEFVRRMEEEARMRPYAEHSVYLGP